MAHSLTHGLGYPDLGSPPGSDKHSPPSSSSSSSSALPISSVAGDMVRVRVVPIDDSYQIPERLPYSTDHESQTLSYDRALPTQVQCWNVFNTRLSRNQATSCPPLQVARADHSASLLPPSQSRVAACIATGIEIAHQALDPCDRGVRVHVLYMDQYNVVPVLVTLLSFHLARLFHDQVVGATPLAPAATRSSLPLLSNTRLISELAEVSCVEAEIDHVASSLVTFVRRAIAETRSSDVGPSNDGVVWGLYRVLVQLGKDVSPGSWFGVDAASVLVQVSQEWAQRGWNNPRFQRLVDRLPGALYTAWSTTTQTVSPRSGAAQDPSLPPPLLPRHYVEWLNHGAPIDQLPLDHYRRSTQRTINRLCFVSNQAFRRSICEPSDMFDEYDIPDEPSLPPVPADPVVRDLVTSTSTLPSLTLSSSSTPVADDEDAKVSPSALSSQQAPTKKSRTETTVPPLPTLSALSTGSTGGASSEPPTEVTALVQNLVMEELAPTSSSSSSSTHSVTNLLPVWPSSIVPATYEELQALMRRNKEAASSSSPPK